MESICDQLETNFPQFLNDVYQSMIGNCVYICCEEEEFESFQMVTVNVVKKF